MRDLIKKWRGLSEKNFVDETLADGMGMDDCSRAHSIKGRIYRQCASELEAALDIKVEKITPPNTQSAPCRFNMLHSSYKAGGQGWCGYCGIKL